MAHAQHILLFVVPDLTPREFCTSIVNISRRRSEGEFEPIAELTKLGWFIMSPGQEFDHNVMLLTQTSQSNYEDLCRLDVLGLQDSVEHDQGVVYDEFKEKLRRDPEGWYEAALPCKEITHRCLTMSKEVCTV